MKKFFNKIKNSLKSDFDENEISSGEEEYVELDTAAAEEATPQVIVRPFIMEDYSDTKAILNTLREGKTIALINIKPLKDKDLIELKRAISNLKKTCDAINGDIAGFGDDYIVVVPSFAKVHRTSGTKSIDINKQEDFE